MYIHGIHSNGIHSKRFNLPFSSHLIPRLHGHLVPNPRNFFFAQICGRVLCCWSTFFLFWENMFLLQSHVPSSIFYFCWSFVEKNPTPPKKRKRPPPGLPGDFCWTLNEQIFRISTNWIGSHGTWLFPWSFWDLCKGSKSTELSSLLNFNESSLVDL